jgi:hypothetical protein
VSSNLHCHALKRSRSAFGTDAIGGQREEVANVGDVDGGGETLAVAQY